MPRRTHGLVVAKRTAWAVLLFATVPSVATAAPGDGASGPESPVAAADGGAAAPSSASSSSAAAADADVREPEDERRKTDPTPRPVEPPRKAEGNRFAADPVGDGAVVFLAVTFGLLSSEILSTGEVRPQEISARFSSRQLLGIDRGAISQTVDPNANALSNVGLAAIGGYAALDTVLDYFRLGSNAAIVDAVMYVEAFTITQGLTNLAKIAFRRPRPRAYIARNEFIERGGDPAAYRNDDTDSALSFFSGHASQAAALSAAATYISFSRSPGTARPWLTLAGGAALTSFVSYERVRSGAHFPTDVIAGAIAGSAVGALVVHMHRADSLSQRPVWVGVAPQPGGGLLTASGFF